MILVHYQKSKVFMEKAASYVSFGGVQTYVFAENARAFSWANVVHSP
jgi:hypothetical protein